MDLYAVYKKTTLAIIIAAAVVIAATVCYVFIAEPISVSNGVQELATGQSVSLQTQTEDVQGDSLFFSYGSTDSDYIWVPMPDGITASDVAIENHYMDGQLWIDIASQDADFYKNSYISGNLQDILGGHVAADGEQIILKLDMDHIYEYNTIFEDGVLYIEEVSPSELYDRIVVLDPDGYVPEENLMTDSMTPSQICVDIASKAKDLLEDEDIKVYVTSLDDREVSDESRMTLQREVRPDMYVRIETSYDSDSKVYGTETLYNGTYFIPGFGSVELADLLEREVTTSIGGKVNGLGEATADDYILMNSTVPTAAVRVGYYTNTQENILLNRDDYRTKIAQGILAAVLDGFTDEE